MYRIFDIKRYSINDGPGIRITFFFKGCPLSCLWCHNPEGISRTQTRMYTPSKCILCGACVHFCPSGALSMPRRGVSGGIRCDASSCTLCGKCAEVCPTKAVEMAARSYTAEQIYAEIAKERPFRCIRASPLFPCWTSSQRLPPATGTLCTVPWTLLSSPRRTWCGGPWADANCTWWTSSTWTQRLTAAAAEFRTSLS